MLIVEDHDDSREVLQVLLKSWGYEADTAADGVRGLELAQAAHYDAVILDLNLPGMDGLEVGRSVSKLFPRPRLIAHSGFDRPIDRERTGKAGFDLHLAKGGIDTIDLLKTYLDSIAHDSF